MKVGNQVLMVMKMMTAIHFITLTMCQSLYKASLTAPWGRYSHHPHFTKRLERLGGKLHPGAQMKMPG